MDELKPDAKDLLRVAREARSPSDDDRARMERRIALAIGAAAAGGALGAASAASAGTSVAPGASTAVGAAGAGASSAAAGASGGAMALKLGGALLCVTLVVAAGWVATRSPEPAPPAPSAEAVIPPPPATPTLAAPVTPPVDDSEEVESLQLESLAPESAAARSARSRPRPSTAAPAPDLAAEVELLHRAQRAWRAGDGALTLALVSEHESRFARSQLRPERTALRILALCALGRDAEARRLAERFLRTTPSSPLRRSVEESCASSP